AFGGGFGGIGQRLGRNHATEKSAGSGGGGLEGCAAVAAHVIEAAVRRAAIKHVGGTALRTGDLQLSRLHFAILEEGRSSGFRITLALLTRSSTCFLANSGRTLIS